ncbi:hypothetical protein KXW37_009945 [Aspergillus fumigatus]|nr:hypothetical protein KXW37_009945 [Aspergillus fumigatus]
MRVHIHSQSIIKWMAGMQVLLWATILPFTAAFPFDHHPNLIEYAPQINDSDIHGHLFKRASDYSGLKFSSTCDAAQIQYVKDELDEIQTVLTQAKTQLRTLRRVILDREQPRDWGTSFADNSRLLNTWQNYFGRIYLNNEQHAKIDWLKKEEGKENQPSKLINRSSTDIYDRIHKSLSGGTLSAIIHCKDDFLKYQGDNEAGQRVYKDTRDADEATTNLVLHSMSRICHESTSAHGWNFKNAVTLKDEICICPELFTRTKTGNKLTRYANDVSILMGKSLNDLKSEAAAGTILHELTHCEHILGSDKTGSS